MIIKMTPCKDCIVLPACKTKALIKCSMLFDYRWNNQKECLQELEKYLPNWKTSIIIADHHVMDEALYKGVK